MPFVLRPSPRRSPRSAVRVPRALWFAVAGWCAVNALVLILAGDVPPFDWPDAAGRSTAGHLVDANIRLLEFLLLAAVVVLLTRRRARPDQAARAPERPTALRETLGLLAYGAAALGGGFLLARAFGWHPFGLHLAGTLYGTHETVSPAEAATWAVYNLAAYAAAPLWWFRRRYPARRLNLTSTDRRGDALVITVVLVLESAVQLLALRPDLLALSGRQLAIGLPLTFVLYLAGAVLPAMVFVYCILVPRFQRLTGSTVATVVLGGLAYAALHVWDAWALFDGLDETVLSLLFVLLTYAVPGMVKTVLTVRTGNAWVHVWAYHALAPHTLIDTPHLVHVLDIK
ncbi:hypothetical protein ACFVH6_03555 [Spirillospora sp. NPDC127200]